MAIVSSLNNNFSSVWCRQITASYG
nr:unnamed protein product [Callosobruchus chinensis]